MDKIVSWPLLLISVLFAGSLGLIAGIFNRLREYSRIDKPKEEVLRLEQKIEKINSAISKAELELLASQEERQRVLTELAPFAEKLGLVEIGFYDPVFSFSDSEQYKNEIVRIREHQKHMVIAKTAVLYATTREISSNVSKGRVVAEQNIKLTLRAFNNESDAVVASTRWNNASLMVQRLCVAREQLNRLNDSNSISISQQYLDLKIKEVQISHEYREKIKFEREDKAEKMRLVKEEAKFRKDLEAAQKQEEYCAVLLADAQAKARSAIGLQVKVFTQQILSLQKELSKAHTRTERARAMAEQTKSGYIYIISNIGSFGEGIVKIGLTRRLDPMDRVRELGDASVPFAFDVHAIIYSDDAPALEYALHKEFEGSRINTQNYRKEFFRTSIDTVEVAVGRLAPSAPFFRDVEAQEYRETLSKRGQNFARIETENLSTVVPLNEIVSALNACHLTASGGASTATAPDARAPIPPPPG